MTLDELNRLDPVDFAAALAGTFENAPWVAEHGAPRRPFKTVAALHQCLYDQIAFASEIGKFTFLNGHPDLAGTAARQREMGEHSTAEQSALGLDRLDDAAFTRFSAMNRAYRTRFGFPFMICVRRHTLSSILESFDRRLQADPAQELATALREVFYITRLRVAGLIQGPGMPVVAGRVSTEVRGPADGLPAADTLVELHELGQTGAILRNTVRIDGDGRADVWADGGPLRIGSYELRFHVGRSATGVVPVQFTITEAEAHYHVPLPASPEGSTTFAGH
jgi:2-oxo-4-hydroxy-4-carboxy-5-ureidoimidazoline decarboxylase